jgi:hypothetical protein
MKAHLLSHTYGVVFGTAFLLATALSAQTTSVTINGTEVPFQPVNGLTVKGVTFSDTSGADFDATNGGQLTFTQDPVIEGQTGGEVITMVFPYPVSVLSFGMAVSGQGTFTNAYTVTLFDSLGNLIQTVPVTVGNPPGDAFSNGPYTSNQPGLISKAVITFNASSPSAFGLDNITFSTDYFNVSYSANLNAGDSFVDFTNTGADGGANLCLNLYTFDPAEELISCCTCSVTPNGLQSLSVLKSLIVNPLTPAVPTAVVIKAVATTGTCNPSNPTFATLAPGMLGWGTTLHQAPTVATTYGVTETPFSNAFLSAAELNHITSTCGFIQANGSGFGICAGCASGGLGAGTSAQ